MPILALGSFYRITYSQWKENPRITAFILYCGPSTNKIHLLNLSAIQLSTVDRIRLMQVLTRLIKAANNQTFTGRQLYRILKQYAPNAIRSCYRTMFRQYVGSYALVNYGLNSEDYFKKNPLLLQRNNKQLFDLANREFMIKSLNFMTGKRAEFKFANIGPINTPPPTTTQTVKPTIVPTTTKFFEPTIKPVTTTPTTPTAPATKPTENNQDNNNEDDSNIF